MMMKFFRDLRGEEGGAAIVELALAAPFLAVMVIGMSDLSRGYSAKVQLEQAAQRSVEKVMQGAKNTTVYNTLKTEAATAAGVSESAVVVDYWLECNGTRSATYETNCTSGQVYARYLSVEITKNYKPMFKIKWAGSKADGSFDLIGKAGIRVQ
jgi:Flp pilus assembly protein TadG